MVKWSAKGASDGNCQSKQDGPGAGNFDWGWHLVWALLVAVGWAQWLLNFVFWLHFLKPPYVVETFHAWIAVILIAVTATIGFVVGYILGVLWNWIHK